MLVFTEIIIEYILDILRFNSYSFDHFCATQRSRPPDLYTEGCNFKVVCGSAPCLTWEASHGPRPRLNSGCCLLPVLLTLMSRREVLKNVIS